MGANESVQSPERKASETRARTVPANSEGVGTHVKKRHADQYGIGRSRSGDQPVSGTSDCPVIDISNVPVEMLVHILGNIACAAVSPAKCHRVLHTR